MLTKDQVLGRKDVQEVIKSCGSIFTKINLDELVLGNHKGDDYYIISNNLFKDYEKNQYLYELRVGHDKYLYDTALILLDKDGNIIEGPEETLNDIWSYGDWKIIKGCKFCCETNSVLLTSIKNNDDIIYSTLRMDTRPEDNLYQLDIEMAYQKGEDYNHCYGEWSDTAIDLNYCPVCGRKLREGKLIHFKGIENK